MSRRLWMRSLSGTAAVVLIAAITPQLAAFGGARTSLTTDGLNPDGTTTLTLPVTADSWVNSFNPTAAQTTSPELVVGSNNSGLSKSRSYLDFDYSPLAAVPAGAVVTSAQLTLSDFVTGSCTGTPIRVSRISGAWTESTLKWSKQPAVTATGSATSTAAYGAAACPAEGAATFDATAIVRAWLAGSAKLGVQVKADKESVASGYRKYRSLDNGDAAKVPTLTLTYDSAPKTPTNLAVSPGLNGYASSLTPTLTARVDDPDGGPVRAFFEVRKGTTPTSPIVWSGTSDPVDAGSAASATVPAGVLVDGTVYSVAAYGQDAVLRSATPAVLGFKTDVTAPGVTITSDPFQDGQWLNPMPSSSTFALDGSADVGGFILTVDGTTLSNGLAANSSGDASFSWTPVAGWHTLEVVPVDHAGNHGDVTTFSFGTGSPAFLAPTDWEGSTGDFPVYMNAPANAVKAALLWHVAGESTWHLAAKITRDDAPWDGSVTTDRGRSSTGGLVWHATQEALGSGTLTAPALIQVRGCFQYPSGAIACTADRYLQLVQQ